MSTSALSRDARTVTLAPVTSRREAALLRAEARRQFVAARDGGTPWSAEVVAATQAALADIDAEAEDAKEAHERSRRISNWWQRKQHDDEYIAACTRREEELRKGVAA